MTVAEYIHNLYPEDYYMSRTVNGDTFWDQEVQVETGYPAGTAVLTRRAKWSDTVNGYQQVQASPDTIAVYLGEFTYNVGPIYQQWVHGEIWNETFQYWERPQPISKTSEVLYDPSNPTRVIGVEYTADYGNGNYLKTVINYNWFTGNVNKHTYRLYWPGATKRVYTQLQIYDSSRFNMDLSDFEGPYEVIEQAGLTNVIYYPDGVTEDLCEVDPYLGVDEPVGSIDVFCDGFVLRVYTDGGRLYLGEILDPNNSTVWGRIGSKIVGAGPITYAMSYDNSILVSLKEKGPNRVVIDIQGYYVDISQGRLAGEAGSTIRFEIYDDFISQTVKFNIIDQGLVNIAQSDDNGVCFVDFVPANVTNEEAVYEDLGEESIATSDGAQDTARYIGLISDEINIIGTCPHELSFGNASYRQYIDSPPDGSVQITWYYGTITDNSEMVVLWALDSADRENDQGSFNNWSSGTTYSKLDIVLYLGIRYISLQDNNIGNTPPASGSTSPYWLEYRNHLSIQYKDYQLTSLEQIVSDLIIPLSIDSFGFASDGAFHSEPDVQGESNATYDIDRIKQVHVLEDFPFNTGNPASPTSHLARYYKLEQAYNTNQHRDEVSGLNFGGGADTALFDADRVRGIASLYTTGTTNRSFIPPSQFADQTRLSFIFQYKVSAINSSAPYLLRWAQSGNSLFIRPGNTGSAFQVQVQVGFSTQSFVASTLNYPANMWHTGHVSINFDDGLVVIVLDGDVLLYSYDLTLGLWAITTGSAFLAFTTTNFEMRIDNFKIIHDFMLPFGGGFFVGNNGISSSAVHKDILSYWDCETASINYGSGLSSTKAVTLSGTGQLSASAAKRGTLGFDSNGLDQPASIVNGANEILDPTSGSISFWFQQQSNAAFFQYLLGAEVDTNNQIEIYLNESGGDSFVVARLIAGGATALVLSDAINDIPLGKWAHVKLTYNTDGDCRLYVNGIRVDSGSWSGTWSGVISTIYLLGNSDGTSGADSFLDELYISSKSLTPENWSIYGDPLHLPLIGTS